MPVYKDNDPVSRASCGADLCQKAKCRSISNSTADPLVYCLYCIVSKEFHTEVKSMLSSGFQERVIEEKISENANEQMYKHI